MSENIYNPEYEEKHFDRMSGSSERMNYFQQETPRLLFRKLTLEDIPSWIDFFKNNDSLHFVGVDLSKSHAELSEAWIRKQLNRYKEQGLGMLAVIEKESGELIGLTGIIPRELEGKSYFEIGYSFKPPYWGKGFATEAAQQMKKFGFESGISDQFISIIDVENYASQAVARKNNMDILFNSIYEGMKVFIFGTKNLKKTE